MTNKCDENNLKYYYKIRKFIINKYLIIVTKGRVWKFKRVNCV